MVTKRKRQPKPYHTVSKTNDVAEFVFRSCNIHATASVATLRLYLAYSEWGDVMSPSAFDQAMAERFDVVTVEGEPRFTGIELAESVGDEQSTESLQSQTLPCDAFDAFDALQQRVGAATVQLTVSRPQTTLHAAFDRMRQQFAGTVVKPQSTLHPAFDRLRQRFSGMKKPIELNIPSMPPICFLRFDH